MFAEPIGAHLPWRETERYLSEVLDLGLAPEFALKAGDLDELSPARVALLAEACACRDLRPTVHAPFFDLNPGAFDPLVRQATMFRLEKSLEVAERLAARVMVVHPGFDPWRFPNLEDAWTDNACFFFEELLQSQLHGRCLLAVENIYESTPETLVNLVARLDHPRFGHCFDIGHWHLFGRRKLVDWLQAILPRLFHLHLHDNAGDRDAHLPVGDGSIDFKTLLNVVTAAETTPSVTLEAHNPAALIRSHRQLLALLGS